VDGSNPLSRRASGGEFPRAVEQGRAKFVEGRTGAAQASDSEHEAQNGRARIRGVG